MPDLPEKKDIFLNLKSRRELSNLLGIEYRKFVYYLYKRSDANNYDNFSIKKKNNELREIKSPIPVIKFLQRNLSNVLYEIYEPKPSVHGFVKERSILSNAIKHVKKRYVINFDLKNYFPSINYGRVRGIFMAQPYNLSNEVASAIAKLVCCENELPQGAPTSPIIANMICVKLDRELQNLAKKYGFTYSRYADDITFSTSKKKLPVEIINLKNTNGELILGEEFINIIENNGFAINESKTRLYKPYERKEVTGLIVNQFPNVSRRYVRQIRAMLHAWEKFGYDAAEREYIEKFDVKNRFIHTEPSFKRVVKGKIDYLGMIRGKDNEIYLKFRKKFFQLEGVVKTENHIFPPPKNILVDEHLKEVVWIIEFDWLEDGEFDCSQGTAFYLEDFGFVTCAHVLPPDNCNYNGKAFKSDEPHKEYTLNILKRNDTLDLAIIKINYEIKYPLIAAKNLIFDGDTKIYLVGFPNYRPGDQLYKSWGHIVQRRPAHGLDRFIISPRIVSGNSGGPVLNQKQEVIGIAAMGAKNIIEADETHYHGVIPITALTHMAE